MQEKHYAHFSGKDALSHVLETKAQGSIEPHGFELPAHLFAALDTARHVALLIVVLYLILQPLDLSFEMMSRTLFIFGLGACIGFAARSAWLGWTKLERLHRSLAQEHYEIEHHRAQERDELKALYSVKGFQGPLLEQVVDVLMADENRLLRIMLEEEMGLSLESNEHPLKHCFGALVGGFISILLLFLCLYFLSSIAMLIASFIIMGAAAGMAAYLEKNSIIPATIWSLAIGGLTFGIVYFTGQLL